MIRFFTIIPNFIRLILVLFLTFSFGCSKPVEKRAGRQISKGDIVIGAVLPTDSRFIKGFKLAVEEINNEGGILGEKIKAIIKDDNSSLEKGKKIAKEFARNPNIVAVVGHLNSHVALPVSITYEYNKIIFFSPSATSQRLTQHEFKFIFRNIPPDREFAMKLVEYANVKQFKKMIILNENDTDGKEFANIFGILADNERIEMAAQFSFNSWDENLLGSLHKYGKELRTEDIDFILIAASVPVGAEIIKIVRSMGVTVPFLGNSSLDSPELFKIAGEAAEGAVVVSIDCPDNKPFKQFSEKYLAKYGTLPDIWAAQVYDAVKVLAYSMDVIKKTIPQEVQEYLHVIRNWQGITGVHNFDNKGDVYGKPIALKVLRNGKFEYIKSQITTARGSGLKY